MLFKLLYRHDLEIHKKIKSNCFLQTPPDSCSASPQVQLCYFHVVLLYHVLIIAYQSQEKCYLNCSIDIFKKFIKKSNQIVFCQLHQILVQHLHKCHCDDFHVVLLYNFLIIAYQSQEKCYLNCLYRHLKIHKKIKSNCFLTTPPDSCSASPQVPLG